MRQWPGLLRSLVIYHNPLRLRAWRRFYATLLSDGTLAFDIGAHVGTRTRAMRAAGARVVALEPQAPFTTYLRYTLPRDVVLIDAAAGRTEAQAEMTVSSRHPTVSSLHSEFVDGAASAPGFGHVRWDRRQQVRVVTLDALIAEHGLPDYIKIDVEGFEPEVLAGLSRPVPMISVEFLPGFPKLTHQVITRLAEIGPYRFNPIVGEGARFLWTDWRDADATRDWLDTLPSNGASGDLFARLEAPPS